MSTMPPPGKSRPTKICLWGLIGSVMIGSVLGILFIVRNTWGWFEAQVMLTTVIIAVTSLCGLACDLSRTPRGRNALPKLGLVLAVLNAGLLLVGIWGDVNSEGFWRITVCTSIIGVAVVHVCLLSLPKLAQRFQWIRLVGNQVIFGFAILVCAVVVGEIESSEIWRLIAATSIVIGAFTLTIPILHRISKLDRSGEDLSTPIQARNIAAIDEEIAKLQKRIEELQQVRASLSLLDSGVPVLGAEVSGFVSSGAANSSL